MLIFTFILASLMFIFTGGAVILLCTWNRYEDALVTLIGGVIISVLIGGTPLLFSKEAKKMEETKMKENSYITIDFTEEEIDEILADYYGLDLDDKDEKERIEDEKASISEYDLKLIILSRLF